MRGSSANPDIQRWRKQPAGRTTGFVDIEKQFTAPGSLKLIHVYGEAQRRQGQAVPDKSEFDPMALGRWLSHCAFFEVTDQDDIVYRIVGDAIQRHFGFNPTRRSYFDFVPEPRRPTARRAFLHCFETPCAMAVRTEQIFESGRHAACEAVGVPLAAGAGPGRARYMLFVDQPVRPVENWNPDVRQMRYEQLLERTFIDLGHGAPDGFVDLVKADRARQG